MQTRLSFAVLTLCFLITGVGRIAAADMPPPDLKQLLEKVRTIVERHYPKAKVTLKDQTIHFEFDTRKFMIHEPLLTGEWQDAHEESGPKAGGIYGDVELGAGAYEGMAEVPQTIDKRYVKLLLMAPYSKKLDHHLYVHLKYPREVPQELIEDVELLMEGYDKQVSAKDALTDELELSVAEDQRPRGTKTSPHVWIGEYRFKSAIG